MKEIQPIRKLAPDPAHEFIRDVVKSNLSLRVVSQNAFSPANSVVLELCWGDEPFSSEHVYIPETNSNL